MTLYGSYESGLVRSLDRLKELKSCLIGRGYLKTSLVSDYPFRKREESESEDAYWAAKSFYWIARSDVNVFAFLCGMRAGSPAVELASMKDEASLIAKTIVLFEERCYNQIETLIRGFVKLQGVDWATFKNEAELCSLSASKCHSELFKPSGS